MNYDLKTVNMILNDWRKNQGSLEGLEPINEEDKFGQQIWGLAPHHKLSPPMTKKSLCTAETISYSSFPNFNFGKFQGDTSATIIQKIKVKFYLLKSTN